MEIRQDFFFRISPKDSFTEFLSGCLRFFLVACGPVKTLTIFLNDYSQSELNKKEIWVTVEPKKGSYT